MSKIDTYKKLERMIDDIQDYPKWSYMSGMGNLRAFQDRHCAKETNFGNRTDGTGEHIKKILHDKSNSIGAFMMDCVLKEIKNEMFQAAKEAEQEAKEILQTLKGE